MSRFWTPERHLLAPTRRAALLGGLGLVAAGAASGGIHLHGQAVSATVYPPGVLAVDNATGNRNCRDTWDLYQTANSGSRIAQGSMQTGAAFTPLPSGITRTSGATGNGLSINSTALISGVDLSNYGLFTLNNGTVGTVTDSGMFGAGSQGRLWTGQDDNGTARGNPTVDYEWCTFDLNGGENADHAILNNFGHPTFINRSRVYNGPRTSIVASGQVMATLSLFGAFGTTFNSGDHTEMFQHFGGPAYSFTQCLFDGLFGLPVLSGISGYCQLQASAAATGLFDTCIMANCSGLIDDAWSMKADFANNTVTVQNCAIDPGLTGGIRTLFANPGFTATMIDGGNNFILNTGVPVNVGQIVIG